MNEVIKKKRGEAFTLAILAMEVSEAVSLAGFQAAIVYPLDVLDAITVANINESEALQGKQATVSKKVMPGKLLLGAVMEKVLLIVGDVELFSVSGQVRKDAVPGLYKFEFNIAESFCLEPPASPGQEGKNIPTQWEGTSLDIPGDAAVHKLTVYLRIT